MSVFVNWAHVGNIVEDINLDGWVFINWANGSDTRSAAKDILVVGDGDMRVNAWLNLVASENKEESDE